MNTLILKFGPTAVKRAIFLGVAGALVMSVGVVTTVTSSNLGTSNIKLATESFTDDPDVSVSAVGILKNVANAAAAGTSAPGTEANDTLPGVNNTLTKNNYAYRFEMKESGVAAWQSGEDFKIEIYGDDGAATSLLATVYTRQSTVDDVNIEGVTVTVDLGSSSAVHDAFDIVITRQ